MTFKISADRLKSPFATRVSSSLCEYIPFVIVKEGSGESDKHPSVLEQLHEIQFMN